MEMNSTLVLSNSVWSYGVWCLALEFAPLAQKSLLWLLFLIGSAKPDGITTFANLMGMDERIPLTYRSRKKDPTSENKDAGENEDDGNNDGDSEDDQTDNEGDDVLSEDGSDGEDDSDSDADANGDEESDDDDDEDDDEEEEDDDDEDDDEDEEEDEEAEQVHPPPKRKK